MVASPDPALRARVGKLWAAWCDQADFTSRNSFYGLQSDAFKTTLVDGEVLALLHLGETLKIQLLPSEFFATMKDNARDIIGGIEYNQAGERTAYWLFDKIPPAPLVPIPYRIDASKVIHLFQRTQVNFERGVSWLSAALTPLFELQTYSEAALVRARTGSLFAGFVRSADGSSILQNSEGEPVFEPGSLCKLRPGDEVSFSSPPDPTQGYAPFIRTQLMQIASSLSTHAKPHGPSILQAGF
jgi:capsid protein